MAAYDPKRPRPSSTNDPDEAPPVDALLDPAPADPPPSDPPPSDPPPSDPVVPPTVDEVDLRTDASSNGNGSRPAQKRAVEVPIAAAPEEGTTNRAVLIAALVSSAVAAVVLALLVRRRGHRDD